METNLLATVKSALNARKTEWQSISDRSGVPLPTLVKVAAGYTQNPGVLTVQKLATELKRAKSRQERLNQTA